MKGTGTRMYLERRMVQVTKITFSQELREPFSGSAGLKMSVLPVKY